MKDIKTLAVFVIIIFCTISARALESNMIKFGFDSFAEVSSSASGNLVYSPASLAMAVGLVASGSKDETKTGMNSALQISNSDQMQGDSSVIFRKTLDSLEAISKRGGVELVCVNSVWIDDKFAVRPEFVANAAKMFDAETDSLNLIEDGTSRINSWVEKKTAGMIKKLVDNLRGMVMVVVNAVYFKGKWEIPFEVKDTCPREFRSAEKMQNVPTMSKTETFLYCKNDGFAALRLPYNDSAISMMIILPDKDDGLDGIAKKLTPQFFSEVRESMSYEQIFVRLPKFRIEVSLDDEIKSALSKMGMARAFTPDADFSGIGGKPGDLYIDKIIQKAVIDVSENGTEAAAATAVMMRCTSFLPTMAKPPKEFIADHPFLFILTCNENNSESILFIGKVVAP